MPDAPAEAEKVAYVHERIHDALFDDLDERWDEVLVDWDESTPGQRDAVRRHVSGLRNRVWSTLQDIQAVEELERGLAVQYVELKARWTMLNTQIQSQVAQGGDPDDPLVYRATCVSLLIQALEPLLRQDQVEALTDRLNESIEGWQ